MLKNLKNYGIYRDLAMGRPQIVTVPIQITKDTWGEHFSCIIALLRDGIETDDIQHGLITIDFGNSIRCQLSVIDYFFNIILWYMIVWAGDVIQPKHIFFEENITKRNIKNYIDEFFILPNRRKLSNRELNNIIDDCLYNFSVLEEFSFYLANTINLEDSIGLMKKDKDFYDTIHLDLSGIPIEDVKNIGMEYTNKSIKSMKNAKGILGYDHCLADSWRSGEGINPKQYKEFAINIGSKPNGQGGVYPDIINSNFINGGLDKILSMFIESSTGRTAQIMSKTNVGESGSFARLLGLNNTNALLHQDKDYICNTKNFQEVLITENNLKLFIDRYAKLYPNGVEFLITRHDRSLIGKKIYLRSPMTCASFARGEGVCYRCYGELAYVNNDINIGKMAAEEISSKLTQILLSAKHLIDTRIDKPEFSEKFDKFFEMEGNIVRVISDLVLKGYNILIDPDSIFLENEEDYKSSDYDEEESGGFANDFNEYISEFHIMTPKKELIKITSKEYKLYFSRDFNDLIRRKAKPFENYVSLDMNLLEEMPLFLFNIKNNELSKTMNRLINILDKSDVTKSYDRHHLLEEMNNTIILGDLNVMSVHSEIILANQLRSAEDILELPQWEYPDEPYQTLTLGQSLRMSPYVITSLMYGRLNKALYDPLTFRKNKASFLDLFFMEKPQDYINMEAIKTAESHANADIDKVLKPLFIKEDQDQVDDDIDL